MKTTVISISSLLVSLIVTCIALGSTPTDKLAGTWKCIREHDGAKIVGSYMKKIEFTPNELILYYVGSPDSPIHCSYTVTRKIINATNLKTKEKLKFDYKFLESGDLYLHKEPWNWEGWFSKDFSKPRILDPRDPKNVYDYFHKKENGE